MYNLEDDVKIPSELDSIVEQSMIKVRKIHRKRMGQNVLKTTACMVIIITIFLGWGYSNPVEASQIPLIGGIFGKVQKNVTYSGDYVDKAVVLETEETETEKEKYCYSVTDNGYTVTVKEVFSDGYSAYIGLQVQNEESFGTLDTAENTDDGTSYQYILLWNCAATVDGEDGKLLQVEHTLEGTQIDEHTFEGIMKVDLMSSEMKQKDDFVLNLDVSSLWYQNVDSMEKSNDAGTWNLSFPVDVDSSEAVQYEVEEQVDGFGISSVIVTPYEVIVEAILPPIYATPEEFFEEKKRIAKEDGQDVEHMTKEEIEEYVQTMNHGNYGVALFDQNGERIVWRKTNETERGICYVYARQERELTELHLYIGEGDIDCAKETNESAMAERALFATTLQLQE